MTKHLRAFLVGVLSVSCSMRGNKAQSSHHASPSLSARSVSIYRARTSESDLEVTGLLSELSSGDTGYVRYSDLAALPLTTTNIRGDENFSELKAGTSLRVSGVLLARLEQSLGALPNVDLVSADCADGYQAHYPVEYIAAHQPLLGLAINHLSTIAWDRQNHPRYPFAPYFITHANFHPSFTVLAHAELPQVPTTVIRLNFTTTAATYNPIAPRGRFAASSPEQQGFLIAKQNCLRCHNQGAVGGLKAGRTWATLGTWAREQPAYFAAYVHNPKQFEPHAKMPGNPHYDQATLAALTAYFRTFTDSSTESTR